MSDWKARAEREAAAILVETSAGMHGPSRDFLVSLLAIAWLQGANYGSHWTLRLTEDAFDELKASL